MRSIIGVWGNERGIRSYRICLMRILCSSLEQPGSVNPLRRGPRVLGISPVRIWSLPGFPRIEQPDHPPPPYGTNYFWFCSRCSVRYAEVRYLDQPSKPWWAVPGICGNCTPFWRELPGGLSGRFELSDFPKEVLAYELDCELRFVERQLEPARIKEEA